MSLFSNFCVICLGASVVLLILVPWLSIYDIHKSIDRVADEIEELRKLIRENNEKGD